MKVIRKAPLLNMLFLAVSVYSASAQSPSIQWQRSYGGSDNEQAEFIIQSNDTGYVVAGTTSSANIDVSGNHGTSDVWLLKLNSAGGILWQRCFGGSGSERVTGLYATNDNGYILTAFTNSTDGDVLNGNGDKGISWTIKIDAAGTLQWQKNNLVINALKPLPGGGYIIAGECLPDDYWIAETDDTLGIIWQKCYGGSKADQTTDIQLTFDGGYIVSGNTRSSDGDIKDYTGNMLPVAWVLKLDDTGAIQWNRTYRDGMSVCIHQLPDHSYLLAGQTTDFSTAAGVHSYYPDYWLMKLSSNGDTLWQRAYGTGGVEILYAMQPTKDNGCIMAGFTQGGVGGDLGFSNGKVDMWVVKVSQTGAIEWQKPLGGMYFEEAHDVKSTVDGGFVLAGYSSSLDADVTRNLGGTDVWIVKLNNNLGIHSTGRFANCLVYPNPGTSILNIQLENELINKSADILDVSGRSVKSFRIENNTTRVSIEDLAAGSYFLRIGGLYYDRPIIKM